jgi:hypothetical protein
MRDAHNERMPTKKELGSSKLRQQLNSSSSKQEEEQQQKDAGNKKRAQNKNCDAYRGLFAVLRSRSNFQLQLLWENVAAPPGSSSATLMQIF